MNIVRAGSSANCFRIAPPLTVTEGEIDTAVEILDAALQATLAAPDTERRSRKRAARTATR